MGSNRVAHRAMMRSGRPPGGCGDGFAVVVCGNTTDHRDDGKTIGPDMTAELLSGS